MTSFYLLGDLVGFVNSDVYFTVFLEKAVQQYNFYISELFVYHA